MAGLSGFARDGKIQTDYAEAWGCAADTGNACGGDQRGRGLDCEAAAGSGAGECGLQGIGGASGGQDGEFAVAGDVDHFWKAANFGFGRSDMGQGNGIDVPGE